MHCIKDDNVVSSHFEITFPLILAYDGSFSITFTLQRETTLEFKRGVYYLHGDNGSGKTTFLNMLALTAGNIGEKARADAGTVK
ncbi:MAG: AAA family ATPase, partial [Desulfobacterales bacterium]|nr:AAA family ATPase [Desulfobacterales bacterium]